MKSLTRNDFRLACGGLAKSSLSKAELTGRVTATSSGKIPLTRGNLFYLEGIRFKRIEQMTLAGAVLPGWAALCYLDGRRRRPLCYYAPLGLNDDDVLPVEDCPDFQLREEDGKIEMADGRVYDSILVYDKKPPAWIDPEAREVLEGTRPPVSAKAPARRPAAGARS